MVTRVTQTRVDDISIKTTVFKVCKKALQVILLMIYLVESSLLGIYLYINIPEYLVSSIAAFPKASS